MMAGSVARMMSGRTEPIGFLAIESQSEVPTKATAGTPFWFALWTFDTSRVQLCVESRPISGRTDQLMICCVFLFIRADRVEENPQEASDHSR